ncbi:glycoside hydrolase family 88 protein [Cohnella lupini]|uniref:Unsaturated rhamnogalacturonyl hydrolase n=1 Tax=Cohnella lupini TaxID=1294267 RepID=A0A3D9ISV3_9BACL|nr:glycoside hydrolase family 88 protein [Cohnella lupini]RED64844.1 unsaturated rhamnogalacturonyl hydrolase [Cohnella lupini]
MEKRELEEAANRVYRFMMHGEQAEWGSHEWTDWAMNIDRWDWNSGVGIIAAAEFGKMSREDWAIQEVEDWVNRNKWQSDSVKVINSMAPYAVFPLLLEKKADPYYAAKAEEIAFWMMEQSPRTGNGAFEHTVTEKASFREQIWADTVFMAVLFLARAARMLSNRRMADEALRQVLLHLRALQDDGTGLLFHAWNCEAEDWMSAARWNRANAWNACGVPMILEALEGCDFGNWNSSDDTGDSGNSGALAEIKGRYVKLAEGLMLKQNASGLWPTVLDRPGYYEETSGSAGIAYGLYKAARMGLLPDSKQAMACADRATAAVISKIGANGAVEGVSGGTPVLDSVAAYNEVPIFPTLYGQGLTLLLLTEAIDLSKSR